MLSISDKVREKIIAAPFIAHALSLGLININELARAWHPEICDLTKKDVSVSAISMSIRRIIPQLQRQHVQYNAILPTEITIRHNLSEKTYQNSAALQKAYRTFLELSEDTSEPFVIRTTGIRETTVIINSEISSLLSTVFTKESILAEIDQLAALILKLPPSVINTPGSYFSYLGILALSGINVIEVVSTTNELVLILKEADIHSAYTCFYKSKQS